MDIKETCQKVHRTALEHGWWNDYISYPEKMMMVITELAESVQEDRSDHIKERDTEIADAIIRLFDLCRFYDIDIETEIKKKMKINESREYKHGKKY